MYESDFLPVHFIYPSIAIVLKVGAKQGTPFRLKNIL